MFASLDPVAEQVNEWLGISMYDDSLDLGGDGYVDFHALFLLNDTDRLEVDGSLFSAVIYHEDNYGFRDYDVYESHAEATDAWDELATSVEWEEVYAD